MVSLAITTSQVHQPEVDKKEIRSGEYIFTYKVKQIEIRDVVKFYSIPV